MPTIVEVHRADGLIQKIDIDNLRYERISHGAVENDGVLILRSYVSEDRYHHPEMRFIVETTTICYRGPRRGDTPEVERVAHHEIRMRAWQCLDVEWLEQNGYEPAGDVRAFAKRLGRKHAPYDELIRYGIGKGLIDDKPLCFPDEKKRWVRWCAPKLDTPERKTRLAK